MSNLWIDRWHDPVRRVDVVRAADFDALLKRYDALREDVIVPGIRANDAIKADTRAKAAVIDSLLKAMEEAASLRESDLDQADDYVKHWRSLILVANRA